MGYTCCEKSIHKTNDAVGNDVGFQIDLIQLLKDLELFGIESSGIVGYRMV